MSKLNSIGNLPITYLCKVKEQDPINWFGYALRKMETIIK